MENQNNSAFTDNHDTNSSHLAVSLPSEILGEVFVLACSLENRSFPFKYISSEFHQSRLFIASVCHRWRAVALSTPTLWNRFMIHVPRPWSKDDQEDPVPPIPSLRLALQRASGSPLDLELVQEERDMRQPSPLAPFLRDILPRCASVSVMINHVKNPRLDRDGEDGEKSLDFAKLLLSSNDNPIDFPSLVHFTSSDTKWHTRVDLARAPKLQKVTIHGHALFSHPPPALVDLAVSDARSLEEALGPLKNSRSLKRLFLSGSEDWDLQTNPQQPIHLPALEELAWSMLLEFPEAGFSKMAFLEAPNLRFLELRNSWELTQPNQFPSLRCLSLREAIFERNIVPCLRHLPSITELVLPEFMHTETLQSLFPALVRREGVGNRFWLFPLLQCVYWGQPQKMEIQALDALIAARNYGQKERPGMPFVVNIPGVEWEHYPELRSEIPSFKKRHPFSVVVKSFEHPHWSLE